MLGKKTGGRKAGTPNRKTKTLEEFFDKANISVPEKLLAELEFLVDPKDRVRVWLDLMGYIYPKRKAVENSGTVEASPYLDISLRDLEEKVLERIAVHAARDPQAKERLKVSLGSHGLEIR